MISGRRSRPGRRPTALLAVLVVLLGAASCSSDGGSGGAAPDDHGTRTTSEGPVAEVAPMGRYPVGSESFDLLDADRETPANGAAPSSAGRALPTLAYYPADGPAPDRSRPPLAIDGAGPREGHFPLVVLAHGLGGRGIVHAGVLAAVASAGYVVIAPDFPRSSAGSPGGPTISDVGNQPGDVSFLIDTFADSGATGDVARIATHVDARHVGMVGHSLGAVTALAVGYSACCTDGRVEAIVSWSGVLLPLKGRPNPRSGLTGPPLLLVHGTEDRTVAVRYSQSAFEKVKVPRWFITLPGQAHSPPFLGPGEGPVGRLVTTATIDFLDAQLKDDPDGIDHLGTLVSEAGPDVATLQVAGA